MEWLRAVTICPDISVRLATSIDALRVERLYRAAYGDDCRDDIKSRSPAFRQLVSFRKTYVAVKKNDVCGVLSAFDWGQSLFINMFYVSPQQIGKGVGQALFHRFQSDHPQKALFVVSTDNPSAIKNYINAGMTAEGVVFELEAQVQSVNNSRFRFQYEVVDDMDTAIQIDHRVVGFDRREHFVYWREKLDARVIVLRECGKPIGYSVWMPINDWTVFDKTSATLGPIGVLDQINLLPVFVSTINRISENATRLRFALLHDSPILPVALQLKFKIDYVEIMFRRGQCLLPCSSVYVPSGSFWF